MKRDTLILILFSILLPTLAISQFEVVLEDFGFSEGPYKLFKSTVNKYILISDGEEGDEMRNDLAIVRNDGVQIFSVTLDGISSQLDFEDVIEMPDSSILVSFKESFCSEPDSKNSILKLMEEAPVGLYQSNYLTFGGIFSDSSFMVFHDIPGKIGYERKTPSGVTIWDFYFILFEPHDKDMVVTALDTIIIATIEGLELWDKDGNFIDSYGIEPYLFDQLELMDQDILLARRADSVFFLSNTFQFIDTLSFEEENIQDLTVIDQKIAILTSEQNVYLFDDTLGIISEFQIPEEVSYNLVTPSPNGLVLAGKVRYGSMEEGKGNFATVLKKYDYSGNTLNTNRDVGLIDVEIVEEPFVFFTDHYELTFQNLKFQVQNFSDSLLNRVNINIAFPLYLNDCSRINQKFSQNFEGLNLEPGQTTGLVWEELEVKFEEDPVGPMELCFWTSMPDQKIDIDTSNDLFCTETDIPTDLDEIDPFANFHFEIFPNPSASNSTIAFQIPLNYEGEIRVFNALGEQVDLIELSKGESTLMLNQYPPGLYFVSLIVVDAQIVYSNRYMQL